MKEELINLLACPYCKESLEREKHKSKCVKCNKEYDIYNNKPYFIKQSSFSSDKFLDYFIKNFKWIIPSPSFNFVARKNISYLKGFLNKLNNPKILIIGGGKDKYGNGISSLSNYLNYSINLEIIDGSLVDIIGDAHNLPFKKDSFDLIIIQAVLEHVENPKKVVNEIFSVLKSDGIVYAEVPFMQGVHARPFDFQRYTLIGVNTLFKDYKKINSGILLGPTASFIWIFREYLSILLSLNIKYLYYFFNLFFGWIFYPLKFLDYIFIRLKFSSNIAGGYYFIGRK